MTKRLGLLSLFSVLALLMAMIAFVPAQADNGPPAVLGVAAVDSIVAPIEAEVAAPATGIPLLETAIVELVFASVAMAYVFQRPLGTIIQRALRLAKSTGSEVTVFTYVMVTGTIPLSTNARSHILKC
jgi:hypothetical protein